MVRALPRLPHFELDGKRIAANSFVIALHVAAFGLLLAPITWTPPTEAPEYEAPMTFVPEVIKIKPVELLPVPRTPATVRPQPRTTPITQPSVPADTNTVTVAEVGDEQVVIAESSEFTHGSGADEPALAELALLSGPPPQYPRLALREGHQGLVLLKVLVDANGLPQDVQIERSSGFRLLDLAAVRQVQSRWRFQPAQVNGRAAAAYALVPINFTLPK